MGKFSDRFNKTLGRRKPPLPNWDKIGEALATIGRQLADRDIEEVAARFVAARRQTGRGYEDTLKNVCNQVRNAALAQLELANTSLKFIDDCSKRADEMTLRSSLKIISTTKSLR